MVSGMTDCNCVATQVEKWVILSCPCCIYTTTKCVCVWVCEREREKTQEKEKTLTLLYWYKAIALFRRGGTCLRHIYQIFQNPILSPSLLGAGIAQRPFDHESWRFSHWAIPTPQFCPIKYHCCDFLSRWLFCILGPSCSSPLSFLLWQCATILPDQDILLTTFMQHYSSFSSQLTAQACDSTWVTSFYSVFFNIHISGVLPVLVPH